MVPFVCPTPKMNNKKTYVFFNPVPHHPQFVGGNGMSLSFVISETGVKAESRGM